MFIEIKQNCKLKFFVIKLDINHKYISHLFSRYYKDYVSKDI